MFAKVFYWLRFFQSTAYFIKIIVESLLAIGVLVILLIVILFSFGAPLYFFNLNRIAQSSDAVDQQIIGSYTGIAFFDVLVHVYLIALGEFWEYGNYSGKD